MVDLQAGGEDELRRSGAKRFAELHRPHQLPRNGARRAATEQINRPVRAAGKRQGAGAVRFPALSSSRGNFKRTLEISAGAAGRLKSDPQYGLWLAAAARYRS